jgi:hypothetical protein
LQVELKDRYNNLVWDESSMNIRLDIPEKYQYILTTENNGATKIATVVD